MTRYLPTSSGSDQQSPPGSQYFEFFLLLEHTRLRVFTPATFYMYTLPPLPHNLSDFTLSALTTDHSTYHQPQSRSAPLLYALVASGVFYFATLITHELNNTCIIICLISVFPTRQKALLIHSYIPNNYYEPVHTRYSIIFLNECIRSIIF